MLPSLAFPLMAVLPRTKTPLPTARLLLMTWVRSHLLRVELPRTPLRLPSGTYLLVFYSCVLGQRLIHFHRMGELEPWMDENFIKGVFLSSAAESVNVKVIRDKNSG